MGTRGWKWPAVGLVCLLLVALGAHLAWERHRYRLRTPRGILWVGMTKAETEKALGPPCNNPLVLALEVEKLHWGRQWLLWIGDGRRVVAVFGEGGRLTDAEADGTSIPRPSLCGHVRSWLVGKREE
jgi:hypothetical protein